MEMVMVMGMGMGMEMGMAIVHGQGEWRRTEHRDRDCRSHNDNVHNDGKAHQAPKQRGHQVSDESLRDQPARAWGWGWGRE